MLGRGTRPLQVHASRLVIMSDIISRSASFGRSAVTGSKPRSPCFDEQTNGGACKAQGPRKRPHIPRPPAPRHGFVQPPERRRAHAGKPRTGASRLPHPSEPPGPLCRSARGVIDAESAPRVRPSIGGSLKLTPNGSSGPWENLESIWCRALRCRLTEISVVRVLPKRQRGFLPMTCDNWGGWIGSDGTLCEDSLCS